MPAPQSIPLADLHAAIERLAQAIHRAHPGPDRLLLLGIANGGVELARRLTVRLSTLAPGRPGRAGTLDISFHRDDIGRHPIPKEFAPTLIPADVTGATVILVDDVLFSGRTVKAALNELFDHGRPAKVELAILADRGFRKLPVSADYTGLVLAGVTPGCKVAVHLDPAKPARDRIEIVSSQS